MTWSRRGEIWPFLMVLFVFVHQVWQVFCWEVQGSVRSASFALTAPHQEATGKSQFYKSEMNPKVPSISWTRDIFNLLIFQKFPGVTWYFIAPPRKFSSNHCEESVLVLILQVRLLKLEAVVSFLRSYGDKKGTEAQTSPPMSNSQLSHNAHPVLQLKTKLNQNEIKYYFPI